MKPTNRHLDLVDKLKLADAFIAQSNKLGATLILPDEYKDIEPYIIKYRNDLPRFVAYVHKLCTEAVGKSDLYRRLHDFYRTLEVRAVQQQRRDRAKRALDWLRKHHPKLTYEEREKWMRRLEQKWGRERLQLMAVARKKTGSGRLSIDEREELLAEFWADVDGRIKSGELKYP